MIYFLQFLWGMSDNNHTEYTISSRNLISIFEISIDLLKIYNEREMLQQVDYGVPYH